MWARAHMQAASTASCSSIDTRSSSSGCRASRGRALSAARDTWASRSGGLGSESGVPAGSGAGAATAGASARGMYTDGSSGDADGTRPPSPTMKGSIDGSSCWRGRASVRGGRPVWQVDRASACRAVGLFPLVLLTSVLLASSLFSVLAKTGQAASPHAQIMAIKSSQD